MVSPALEPLEGSELEFELLKGRVMIYEAKLNLFRLAVGTVDETYWRDNLIEEYNLFHSDICAYIVNYGRNKDLEEILKTIVNPSCRLSSAGSRQT